MGERRGRDVAQTVADVKTRRCGRGRIKEGKTDRQTDRKKERKNEKKKNKYGKRRKREARFAQIELPAAFAACSLPAGQPPGSLPPQAAGGRTAVPRRTRVGRSPTQRHLPPSDRSRKRMAIGYAGGRLAHDAHSHRLYVITKATSYSTVLPPRIRVRITYLHYV